ncbi:MAG: hypothetical protein ACK5RO_01655 [Pseudobdellovibrionaceae bacterium]
MGRWIFILIGFFPTCVFADLSAEVGGYYYQSSFNPDEAQSESQTFFHLDLLAGLDSKSRWYGGFHFHQNSKVIDAETDSNYSATEMGPVVFWMLDSKKRFSLFAGYNLKSDAQYTSGGITADWQGSGFFGGFSLNLELKGAWSLGVRGTWNSVTYDQETISGTAENVTRTRSEFLPSLVLIWRK